MTLDNVLSDRFVSATYRHRTHQVLEHGSHLHRPEAARQHW